MGRSEQESNKNRWEMSARVVAAAGLNEAPPKWDGRSISVGAAWRNGFDQTAKSVLVYHTKVLLYEGIIVKGIIHTKVLLNKGIIRN